MEYRPTPALADYCKGIAAATLILSALVVVSLAKSRISEAAAAVWTERYSVQQANTYTTGPQYTARVGMSFDGRFTIAWNSGFSGSTSSQDGSGVGIAASWFDPDGSRIGTEYQVNSYTTNDQLVSDVEETFYQGKYHIGVSFDSFLQDGDQYGAYLRLYTDGVADDADALQANLTTAGEQDEADFFFSGDTGGGLQLRGGVVFENFQPGSGANVLFRGGVYNSSGGPYPSAAATLRQLAGQEFQINTYTTGYQGRPSACGHTDGDFVVVWVSFGQDPSGASIFGRLGHTDTGGVGSEFQVSTFTAQQDRPEVCCSDNGFVVAWPNNEFGPSLDGDGGSVSARRFDKNAQPLGTEFIVNQFTTGSQTSPRIACDSNGNFAVVWTTFGFENAGVQARAFASDGTPLGGDHLVTSTPSEADIGLADDGTVVVAWQDAVAGGDSDAVVFQGFTVPGLGAINVCGDPVDPGAGGLARAVTATDALIALQAAVGAGACLDCVCDVNSMGGVTATDALIILQAAVGQQVVLNCPACT